jgi:hypothetical protein
LWQRIYRIFAVGPLENAGGAAHIREMKQTQYTIKEAFGGTFTVEVRGPDGVIIPFVGFTTRETAEERIRTWKTEQMTAAADRWDATQIGRLHRND